MGWKYAGWVLVLIGLVISAPTVSLAQARAGYGIRMPGLVPGRDYVAGQTIVGLLHWGKEGDVPHLASFGQGRVTRVLHGSAVLLEFPSEVSALRRIPALLADPNVSFPDMRIRAHAEELSKSLSAARSESND
jgi:hypothetical protein